MVKAIESSGTQSNLESVTAGIIKKGRRRKPVLRKKLVEEITCRQLLLVVGGSSTVIRSLATMIPFNLDLLQLVYAAG